MLDALLGLELGIDLGGSGSYFIISPRSRNSQIWGHSPAAAAGSATGFLADSTAGLPDPLPIGLLLRLGSVLMAGGERDLRSKREGRLGSVWSNRERFAARRSVSSMVALPLCRTK